MHHYCTRDVMYLHRGFLNMIPIFRNQRLLGRQKFILKAVLINMTTFLWKNLTEGRGRLPDNQSLLEIFPVGHSGEWKCIINLIVALTTRE